MALDRIVDLPRRSLERRVADLITLADRARDARQWERAAQLYRKALDRDPINPPIWVQYGHALKEAGALRDPGKLAQAEVAYRQALGLDPSAADTHLQLGHVLKLQGKTAEAQAAYLRALALDSQLADPTQELSRLGWSDTELSELRCVLGTDSIAPREQSSVKDTVLDRWLTRSESEQPAAGKEHEVTSHHEPGNLPIVAMRSPDRAGSSFLDAREAEDAQLIVESGLFDTTWYTKTYNDSDDPDFNPVLHYLRSGAKQGWDPNPLFDSDWYLTNNSDVAADGVNPLVHYLRSGAVEGRAPNPLLRYVVSGGSRAHPPTTHPRVCVPDLFELRGLRPRGSIAVVLHLFDPDLWNEMREAVEHISHPFDLFVSLVKGSSEHVRPFIMEAFPHAYVFDFEDHGRDIGSFIAFLQSGVLFEYDLICKLHTKRSPHREDGDAWRRALIAGVLGSPVLIDRVVSNFRSDPDLGMVVADGNIYRGHNEWSANEKLLGQLLPKIGISPDVKDRSFPGGSIFWIRSFLLRTLAGVNISIDDFDPEPLQKDGTLGHAVERMFGLICEDAGMRVVESSQLPEIVQQPAQKSSRVHLIAFYLPQFHPIPENDKWWGAGFTEWINVTRAEPLYKGHRQPRLPSELGFYDLRLPEVREAQAELAHRHGLSAFCYYYYWFNGRRVLERPLDEVLASGKPDFPFLICWANEPWTRNWDGFNRDILLPQEYEPGWEKRFAGDVAPLLRDHRYFRLNGEPMLLIYRIGHIPQARSAMHQLRTALREEGVPEVHLAAAWVYFPDDDEMTADPSASGLDAYFEIPPHWLPAQPLQPLPPGLSEEFTGELKDYNRTVTVALAELDEPIKGRRHRGVMIGWDPTARKGQRSVIFQGGTPTSFRRWLRGTVAYEHREEGERVVFINAWNEWAEGAYLEPDREFGRGWLEAVASVAKVSEAGVRAARANPKDGAHRLARSQGVDRLFDIAEGGAVLSHCPLSIRPYVLELITTGVTVIRGSLPPSLCDEVRNGFVSFARQHDEIFRVNRDEYGHYPRIVNLHTAYHGLFDLFACNQVALAIQDYLFQAETVLYTSLFYERGSAQATHRDTPLFATRPEYRYFGTWVALEDTDADNGPLLVMRRGHLLPEIDREAMARRFYVNLDDLQPMSDDLWTCYQEEVAAQCARAGLGTQTLCVEKGDTIIWHPQTPHGGAEIRDLGRTRYSLVMHTTPFGVPVYHQDVFFHPSKPVSDKAPWDYVLRGQRRYADFREVSFGHVRDYPLEAFNVS